MSKFSLDLSKFKKVKSDASSTTLHNGKGLEFKIAHKALKPEMRQQLDRLPMAEGGMISNSSNQKGAMRENYKQKKIQRYAFGMQVDGGSDPAPVGNTQIQDIYNQQASINSAKQFNPAPDMAPDADVQDDSNRMFVNGQAPQNFDSRAWVQAEQMAQQKAAADAAAANSARTSALQENAIRARAGLPGVAVPAIPSQTGQPLQVADNSMAGLGVADSRMPASDQNGAPSGGNDPWGMEQATNAQIAALGEQKQGALGTAKALGNLGSQQAGVEQGYQTQAQQNMNSYNQANSQLTQERQGLTQDIQNGHIDPQHYINSMSTGGRILQGIGLILGGMGSGITGGPNLAYNKMQSDIDRDIQSQRDELGKKQNLLSNNLNQTQNLRAASELTRMQTNDIVSSHLKQLAYAAQDPIQKANLLSISGSFDGQTAQLQHQLAMQKAMMGQMQSGDPEQGFKAQTQYLRMTGQDKYAEDLEKKHVPGVGQADREVDQKDRDRMTARTDLANKIVDLQQFAAQNGGSLNPATVNQGKAKAQLVQDAYRRANDQGVFREAEKDFVNQIASDNPTQFFEKYRSGQGYQELGRDNLMSLNQLRQSYGLPSAQMPRAAQGPQTKTVNGKVYIRGN